MLCMDAFTTLWSLSSNSYHVFEVPKCSLALLTSVISCTGLGKLVWIFFSLGNLITVQLASSKGCTDVDSVNPSHNYVTEFQNNVSSRCHRENVNVRTSWKYQKSRLPKLGKSQLARTWAEILICKMGISIFPNKIHSFFFWNSRILVPFLYLMKQKVWFYFL